MEILYGKLIEISAIWGVRVMLKLIKKKILPRIQHRICIDIPERGHLLHGAAADKHIEFIATISNPTPIELIITAGTITILNQDIPFGIHTVEQIVVPKESSKYRITLAIYNPFLNPLGLPTINERWKLRGLLKLHCYYGDWNMSIDSPYFSADCQGWENIKKWVDTEKSRLGGL